jgi:uncharacterized protein (TIGR03437 family)
MEFPIRTGERFLVFVTFLATTFSAAYAQSQSASGQCLTSAVPPTVSSEGLAEQMGDVIIQCSGSIPGAVITGNYAISLPVNITNQINASNLTTEAEVLINYGLGSTPSAVPGLVSGNTISFNGLNITIPASGSFSLTFTNVRADVNQLSASASMPIVASLSVPLLINQAQITVAYTMTGLFATLYSTGVTCTGSPLPSTLDMADLFADKTALFSTRMTEGFAGAFTVESAGETNGTRFLVTYSGFPANASLYVPNFVAGSDATVPTAGGDLNLPQAAGQWLPGSGTLLLSLVQGADATGTGGTPLPPPTGSGPVVLNAVSQVPLTNGTGYAVYEVVSAGTTLIESAQFPTFLGLPPVTTPALAQETLFLAPVSTVTTASISAPVPRFASVTPASDCSIIGDCGAAYFPKLNVPNLPVQLTTSAGASTGAAPGYIYVQNAGGGIMSWTSSVTYVSGSGWLTLYTPTNENSATISVGAQAQSLSAGTYQANVVINAGNAGSATIPVTLTVQPAPQVTPPASAVTVTSVVNAATFADTPLVAGSLATVMGSNLSGANVSAAFNGAAATLLYTSATQINLQVPAGLGSDTAANLVVTVNGVSSAPVTVQLAPAWPAIFAHGVLNQDNQVNSASEPAPSGSILQIFATGIPAGITVTAQIGSQAGLTPLYFGPAPSLPGVQQVNVAVPTGLTPQTTQLTLCATVAGKQYCSPSYSLITD